MMTMMEQLRSSNSVGKKAGKQALRRTKLKRSSVAYSQPAWPLRLRPRPASLHLGGAHSTRPVPSLRPSRERECKAG